MNFNFYLKKAKLIKEQNNGFQKYTYKHYIKDGENIIFQKNMTRDEFEKYREDNKLIVEYSGMKSLRESLKTNDCFVESVLPKKDTNEEENKLIELIFNKFIKEYKIVKIEEFRQFFNDYVFNIESNSFHSYDYIKNYINNLKELVAKDKEYVLKLFR